MARTFVEEGSPRELADSAREWEANQRTLRTSLFAKGAGWIQVCIEENLEERLLQTVRIES